MFKRGARHCSLSGTFFNKINYKMKPRIFLQMRGGAALKSLIRIIDIKAYIFLANLEKELLLFCGFRHGLQLLNLHLQGETDFSLMQ